MQLSQKDLVTINNSEFLITKNKIVREIEIQLNSTKKELENLIFNNSDKLGLSDTVIKSNISKGENYKNLPFVILDFPSVFEKDNIFAYRTMFWWGNYFSATIHIQGKHLNSFRSKLVKNFRMLLDNNIFICVNETPWEYHFENDNFALLSNEHFKLIETKHFIKLSKKIPLESYSSITQFSSEYFTLLLKVLTT